MAKDVKYIIIPEYKPLYAMRKCFGPRQGPLLRPNPTPITVIAELLQQKPPQELTVLEVVPTGKNTFSEPVKLALNNYMLPYEDIVAGKTQDTPVKMEPVRRPRNEVKPDVIVPGNPPKVITHDLSDTIKVDSSVKSEPAPAAPVAEPVSEVPAEPVPETVPEAVPTEAAEPAAEPVAEPIPEEPIAPTEDTSTPASEAPVEETPDAPAQTEEPAERIDTSAPDVIPNPYAGMSKKERKEARRAEREAAKNN